jgi:hypothetical protein
LPVPYIAGNVAFSCNNKSGAVVMKNIPSIACLVVCFALISSCAWSLA